MRKCAKVPGNRPTVSYPMKLYALTYTDPSEPWGVGVLDHKLYRTPSAVCDAANAHFDEWCERMLYNDSDETMRDYYAKELVGPCAINYQGETLDEVLANVWSMEFGFGVYTVV